MSDFWIVSAYQYVEQPDFATAEFELNRLQAKFPKMNFRVYRCKSRLKQSGNYPGLIKALTDLIPAAEFANMEQSPPGYYDPEIKAARAAIATAKATP